MDGWLFLGCVAVVLLYAVVRMWYRKRKVRTYVVVVYVEAREDTGVACLLLNRRLQISYGIVKYRP